MPVSEDMDTCECGGWLSEAVLWSEWFHVGVAVALTESDFLAVEAEIVADICAMHPVVAALYKERTVRIHVRKVAERKFPEFFEFLFFEFCPEFCSEFSRIFLRTFLCFVSWETENRKIHQKSLPCFNAKFPGKHEKKYSQNSSGEQAK